MRAVFIGFLFFFCFGLSSSYAEEASDGGSESIEENVVEELTEEETKLLEKILGGKKIKVQKINRVSREDLRVILEDILKDIRESEKVKQTQDEQSNVTEDKDVTLGGIENIVEGYANRIISTIDGKTVCTFETITAGGATKIAIDESFLTIKKDREEQDTCDVSFDYNTDEQQITGCSSSLQECIEAIKPATKNFPKECERHGIKNDWKIIKSWRRFNLSVAAVSGCEYSSPLAEKWDATHMSHIQDNCGKDDKITKYMRILGFNILSFFFGAGNAVNICVESHLSRL